MQKKIILSKELPENQNAEGWWMTGAVRMIKRKRHLILDLYRDNERLGRLAVNKTEYAIFDYMKKTWKTTYPEMTELNGNWMFWRDIEADTGTEDKIKNFTKSNAKVGRAIEDKLKEIYFKKEVIEEKKKEEKKQNDLIMTPEIPEGFDEWAEQQFEDTENTIWYKRKGKTAEIHCGVCGRNSKYRTSEWGELNTFEPPRAGRYGMCPKCLARGRYKQAGRSRDERWSKTGYLIQNTEDGGIVVRMFETTRVQNKEYKQFFTTKEVMREYMNKMKTKKYYLYVDYLRGDRWETRNPGGGWGSKAVTFRLGEIYQGYENTLRYSDYFKYCDIEAYAENMGWRGPLVTDVIKILETYANMPQVELTLKMGLKKIVRMMVQYGGVWAALNKKAKDAAGFLKIEKYRMKNLGDISVQTLGVLQYEKRSGNRLDQNQIEVLEDGPWDWEKRIENITQWMSLKKATNRIAEYAEKEFEGNIRGAFIEYDDYLKIRQEQEYDMTNSVFLHPRNLKETHTELIKERERRRDERYLNKVRKDYPEIEKQYKKLMKKYRWEYGEYVIRPARNADEIVMEGRLLHHCVGGQGYLSKHNQGESYILMLRKKEEQEIPYITIEIRNTEIVQWYGIKDSKPDQENMDALIEKYVKYLEDKLQVEKVEVMMQAAV